MTTTTRRKDKTTKSHVLIRTETAIDLYLMLAAVRLQYLQPPNGPARNFMDEVKNNLADDTQADRLTVRGAA